MIFKSLFLFFSMGIFALACEKDECIDQSEIDTDAACIEVYDPVCGCDGKTYSNTCFAENAGVTSWEEGECPQELD